MPSTRDIRRRIKSVKNTAQITKAMQMVAAAKMRKAQQAALVGRPYADLMNAILAEAGPRIASFKHPLMEIRPVKKRAVIVVSSDRGLCGGLNSNIFREVAKLDKNTTVFITAGRKAAQFIARTKRQLAGGVHLQGRADVCRGAGDLQICAGFVPEGRGGRRGHFVHQVRFHAGAAAEHDSVFAGRQNQGGHGGRQRAGTGICQNAGVRTDSFEFEPDEKTVLSELLPHSLNFQMHQILLEAKASEQSARMVAMKNATDNAKQLIKDLTLEYNKLRQANITKELLEITTAQMAVG